MNELDCLETDSEQDFLENFIVPTIQANGLYENVYLMGTSIARPCIIKNALKVAKEEKCAFLSHGATGKVSRTAVRCQLFDELSGREMIRSDSSLEPILWIHRSRCWCLGVSPSFSTRFRQSRSLGCWPWFHDFCLNAGS